MHHVLSLTSGRHETLVADSILPPDPAASHSGVGRTMQSCQQASAPHICLKASALNSRSETSHALLKNTRRREPERAWDRPPSPGFGAWTSNVIQPETRRCLSPGLDKDSRAQWAGSHGVRGQGLVSKGNEAHFIGVNSSFLKGS